MLADISQLGFQSAVDAATTLFQQTKIAAIPGTAFYSGEIGETLLRCCLAKDDGGLKEVCQRLYSFKA